ncbi:MAG: cytochrome C [Gammaproteobacteria bacterium]
MRTDAGIIAVLTAIMLGSVAIDAHAASLESLVMPGPVIEGHAELEDDCGNCHDLFERSSQRTLCLECHEPIADDIKAGSGFHGLDPTAATGECNQCHTEHEGRDADITSLRPDLFDHNLTDFPLTGVHRSQSCASCHEPGVRHAEANRECSGCHEGDDLHRGTLGSACADCHETDRWRSGRFDHATTEFALEGSHAEADCLGCHADQRFESPGSQCIGCHRSDDAHKGANGDACGDCHNAESWETDFDHASATGFALLGAHSRLECRNCHVDESTYEGLTPGCHGCHSGDDVHLGRNGTACGDCHDQSSWTATFDHKKETGFELAGAHGALACTQCHVNGLDAPLAVECFGCHEADDPHAGTLDECDSCHGQTSWLDDQRFHHDLAGFALVGLHRTATCESCHDSLVFSPVAHECTDCHASEDVHAGAMGSDCASCHNPAGWSYWTFDHRAATEFALTGAHEDLSCEACHPGNHPAAQQSRACVSCHRADDVHRGGFGQNCDRCHLTDGFEVLKDDL